MSSREYVGIVTREDYKKAVEDGATGDLLDRVLLNARNGTILFPGSGIDPVKNAVSGEIRFKYTEDGWELRVKIETA